MHLHSKQSSNIRCFLIQIFVIQIPTLCCKFWNRKSKKKLVKVRWSCHYSLSSDFASQHFDHFLSDIQILISGSVHQRNRNCPAMSHRYVANVSVLHFCGNVATRDVAFIRVNDIAIVTDKWCVLKIRNSKVLKKRQLAASLGKEFDQLICLETFSVYYSA